jgi:hypothetical protein
MAGCRHDDAAVSPSRTTPIGATDAERVGTTTTTGAELSATPTVPATSSLDGVGGGLAPGMPASFPRSSTLMPDPAGTRAPVTTGTPATALDSTVVPAPFVNRAPAEATPSEPLVSPGLESTTQHGYQGPTGGPMRPGAASNPDTTSGAR